MNELSPAQSPCSCGQLRISEAEFQQLFDEFATVKGWTWCGYRPARQRINGEDTYRTPVIGQKGCPDRILGRRGVVLLIELKAEDGRLSEDQKVWQEAFKGYPGYYVVRPSDWEKICRILE